MREKSFGGGLGIISFSDSMIFLELRLLRGLALGLGFGSSSDLKS
jgi:hypothetical protein